MDVWNGGVFMGVFHARTRSAFNPSVGLLSGKDLIMTPEVPRFKVTRKMIDTVANGSTCRDPPQGTPPVMLCGVARNHKKLAVEWVQWHRLIGTKYLRIYDDSSVDNLAEAVQPFLDADVLTLAGAPWPRGVNASHQPATSWTDAVLDCIDYAEGLGDPHMRIAVVSISDFVVLPELECIWELFPKEVDEDAALALPLSIVGHGDAMLDTSRTPFERTNFAGGATESGAKSDVVLFLTQPNLPLLLSVPSVYGQPYSSLPVPNVTVFVDGRRHMAPGSREWPTAVTNSTPRVIKYIARSLVAAIMDALWCNDYPGSSAVFNLAAVNTNWKRQEGIGYTPLSDAGTKRLLRLHRTLLLGLGHPPTKRRERYSIAHRGGEQRGAQLEQSGVLYRAPKSSSRPTNLAVLRKQFLVRPERLLRNVTVEHVRMLNSHRCQAEATRNITFCGYVRNRAKLTVEWIQWHRLLGVKFFHIYDDDSEDGLATVLQPFIEEGVVALHPAPEPPYYFRGAPVKGGLMAAYSHCADNVPPGEQWVGYVDPDEFTALADDDCLWELMDTVAAKTGQTALGGVAIPWVDVGHDNEMLDEMPSQLLRTRFAMGKHDNIGRVKCIVRADLPVAMKTAHKPELKAPYHIYFRTGRVLKGEGWFSGIQANDAVEKSTRMLHYHARSLASWIQRSLDGFADDDNKIWAFDMDVAAHRWQGALHVGFDKQFSEDARVRRVHKELLRALGYHNESDVKAATPQAAVSDTAPMVPKQDE